MFFIMQYELVCINLKCFCLIVLFYIYMYKPENKFLSLRQEQVYNHVTVFLASEECANVYKAVFLFKNTSWVAVATFRYFFHDNCIYVSLK